jgi:MFS family permease
VRRHYKATFALLAIATIGYALLQSLVAPALPDIQHALHTSVNGVSWVLTAYLLSASIATPLIGRLGDMYGKQRLLVAVLVVLCAATVISAVATSLPLMLAGRVVQGAAGGVFPLAFGIIRDEFPRERVAGAIGVMSALTGAGAGAGVVLAGPIVDHLSYHSLFWLPLIPLVAATVAIHLFVPESPIRVPGRVSWLGAALMAVGLGAVLVAVSETPVWHWLSAKTLVVLAGGLVVLVAWVVSEARSEQPLVDMRMMRIRGVWTTNAVALLLGFGMYASFVVLPEYVETPRASGTASAPRSPAPACSSCPPRSRSSSPAPRRAAWRSASARNRRSSPARRPPGRRTSSLPSHGASGGRSTSGRCCSAPGSASPSRRW